MGTTKLRFATHAWTGRLHANIKMTNQEKLVEAVREFLAAWDEPDCPEAMYEAVQQIRLALEAQQ